MNERQTLPKMGKPLARWQELNGTGCPERSRMTLHLPVLSKLDYSSWHQSRATRVEGRLMYNGRGSVAGLSRGHAMRRGDAAEQVEAARDQPSPDQAGQDGEATAPKHAG